MFTLELKIPPILQLLVCLVLMAVVSWFSPGTPMLARFRWIGLAGASGIGGLLAVSGIRRFKKVKTTVNPLKPARASSLVTSGVYKKTRNPMYLGVFFLLIGWGFFLGNAYSLIFPFLFCLYMTRFQIQPEERALEAIFGEEYLKYKKRVRRWL